MWNTFENRFKKVLRGKGQIVEDLQGTRVVDGKARSTDSATLHLHTASATNLSMLDDSSIDYIFTDPPYGGAIQYIELGTLWTAWMDQEVDATQEITINPRQGKGAAEFESMIHEAFCEAHRVLKTGKWMHVTFHSKHFDIWSAILRAIVQAGFHLEHVLHQPPLRLVHSALPALWKCGRRLLHPIPEACKAINRTRSNTRRRLRKSCHRLRQNHPRGRLANPSCSSTS